MKYWLMKSEPGSFSIDDLARAPRKTTAWDGIRNYQARNMLRDEMRKGDQVLFYHSSCDVPGVAGIAEVMRTGYPDPTAFDPKHHHYDPESDPDDPTWFMVDVRLVRKLKRVITLDELRATRGLSGMQLLKRGNRLSVMPVSAQEWQRLLALE
jgi:predicted RNA-binding protein with PUA-like domain